MCNFFNQCALYQDIAERVVLNYAYITVRKAAVTLWMERVYVVLLVTKDIGVIEITISYSNHVQVI